MKLWLIAGCLLLAGCAATRPVNGPPPPALALDPCYTKSATAAGIPISASDAVPDEALLIARRIVLAMLEKRPDLAQALVSAGQRVMIMGVDERITDVPEQRDWKKQANGDASLTLWERQYYAERIRRLTESGNLDPRQPGRGGQMVMRRGGEKGGGKGGFWWSSVH